VVHVVKETVELAALVEGRLLREPRIAMDTESNSFFRYPEQLCLVQVATPSGAWVIDPLAMDDVSPLGRLLADERVEKVFHAADNDIRSFDRQWGYPVRNVFDTAVGGRFLGMERSGLDTVLQEGLGITIEKNKALQRQDWSVRPLSEEALAYAVDDVVHLLSLREELSRRLAELGRTEWVAEECARLEETRYTPPEPPEVAFLSMKGTRELDGRGLAVLRELYVMREAEARRRSLPPFRVLSNRALLYLAADPHADLDTAPDIGPATKSRLGTKIRDALRRGVEARPVARPRTLFTLEMRPTKEQLARLKALKEWRQEHGRRLAFDPSLVWPMASLERLAREPQALEEEIVGSPLVRNWQRKEFGASLREQVRALTQGQRKATAPPDS
jgi:ribonuclease D